MQFCCGRRRSRQFSRVSLYHVYLSLLSLAFSGVFVVFEASYSPRLILSSDDIPSVQ